MQKIYFKYLFIYKLSEISFFFFFVWRTKSQNFRISAFDLFNFNFVLLSVSQQLRKILFASNINVCDRTVYSLGMFKK